MIIASFGALSLLAAPLSTNLPVCPVTAELDGPQARDFDALALNAIQAIGTHNSYKQFMPAPEMALLLEHDADAGRLDYGHRPLREQLDAGVRKLEIDVYYDPEGGVFADPELPRLTQGQPGARDYNPSRMEAPGFKVLHMYNVDVWSHCPTLIACMSEIRDWSLENPDHIPLFVMFNVKDHGGAIEESLDIKRLDVAAYDAMDEELRSVFALDHVLTPDHVRQGLPTLREAVLSQGWPSLGEVRGKILFALDEGEDDVALYSQGRPSLEGRMMFVKSTRFDADHAAIFVINDPIRDEGLIRQGVEQGFLVRTRSDAGTIEARENSTSRRDVAMASGAHWISTDYIEPRSEWSEYSVAFPEGQTVRCNPVTTQSLADASEG